MRAELHKIRAYGRRVLTAVMAAACFCTMGCADPRVPAELPDASQSQIHAEDSIFNLGELPDIGYIQSEQEFIEKYGEDGTYVSIGVGEIATPEPVISYPGVNISYSQEITAFATDSSIYMRVRPDKSTDDDNIVKKVQDAYSAKFSILGKTDDWYYAQYTEDGVDYRGFVRKDDFYVGEVAPTPTPEPTKKPKKDNKDDKKDDKKEDEKEDKKEEGTPKPTPTPRAKKVGKTPYSNKYSKVSIKYEEPSEGIKFETTTLDGDTVSDSLFSRNGITMVNIWTQT